MEGTGSSRHFYTSPEHLTVGDVDDQTSSSLFTSAKSLLKQNPATVNFLRFVKIPGPLSAQSGFPFNFMACSLTDVLTFIYLLYSQHIHSCTFSLWEVSALNRGCSGSRTRGHP